MVSELVPETTDLRTIINTVKVEKLKIIKKTEKELITSKKINQVTDHFKIPQVFVHLMCLLRCSDRSLNVNLKILDEDGGLSLSTTIEANNTIVKERISVTIKETNMNMKIKADRRS